MLEQKELNDILSKIGLDSFKEEVKIKNEKRGRKPKDVVNYWYHAFSEIKDYNDLSPWVDDVLTGAANLSTSQTFNHASPMMIYHILKYCPFLSVLELKNHLNRKRQIMGDHLITSDSYIRELINRCVSAMHSLDYYIENGFSFIRDSYDEDEFTFNVEQDKQDYLSYVHIDHTPLEYLDKLKAAGLTDDEIINHLEGKKNNPELWDSNIEFKSIPYYPVEQENIDREAQGLTPRKYIKEHNKMWGNKPNQPYKHGLEGKINIVYI